MEHGGQHGCAEDKAHLVLGLPGLQLLHHVLRNEVSLLYVDPVRRDNLWHVLAQAGRTLAACQNEAGKAQQ